MTVDDLRAMANDKICFGESGDVLLVRSQVYGYADFFRYDAIASIDRTSTDTVRISIPAGTMKGDHEIVLDFSTGFVTADGKVFDEPVRAGFLKRDEEGGAVHAFHQRVFDLIPQDDAFL